MRQAGLAVDHLSTGEARRAEPFISPDVRGALFFPNDWQVDNRKLLAALRRYAEINGIEILEKTQIKRVIVEDGRVVGAETDERKIIAGNTVLATGAWTSLIKLGDADMPINVEPVRGQMICLRPETRLFKHVIYSRRGYIVPRADGRILAGSTSENVGFERAVTDEATIGLQNMATEISPFLSGLPVTDRWSGLRPFAVDGMPILGRFEGIEGLFIATAHYRNGVLLAPLTARLAAESLVNRRNSEYLELFGPDRFRLRGVGSGG